MSNKSLTQRPEFKALQKHHAEIKKIHTRDLFVKDKERFEKFHVKQQGVLIDYSKRKINEETIKLLMDLARAADVEKWRDKMFAGEVVNTTENRPALHVALRGSVDKNLSTDEENVSKFVSETLAQMKEFSDKTRKSKKIKDVVSIGIGGSDLGTRTVCEALEPFSDGPRIHFIANIDGAAMEALLKNLTPEATLFVVISKTFTTLETRVNAETAKAWLTKAHQNPENQFVAVTENVKEAEAFGIRPDNIFPMRKWVGGRYSVWSAVGLPVMLAIGYENFKKFLRGAHDMDMHFKTAKLEKNMPVLMAMLGIWERNFFDHPALAILPYAQGLRTFTGYMQQLDMESNGKSVDRVGKPVDYATGPIIFGDPGTNAQHAFCQALHQGTDIVPIDFIIAAKAEHKLPAHHLHLNANALAQAKAFLKGQDNAREPWRHYAGDRPNTTIVLDRLDPYHLGMLMALYEHKIFVQGIIWNINSFDQWGVELGKLLSKDITQALENDEYVDDLGGSTGGLARYLKSLS